MLDWPKPFASGFYYLLPAGGGKAIIQLEACFANTGNLTLVCEFAEADTADAVVAKISMGTTADLAAVVLSGRELCGCLLLENH